MKIELIVLIAFAVVATFIVVSAVRHTFVLSEGYAGLLYHKGLFVEVLGSGRHVRWGRRYRMVAIDVRKAFINVPAQEVLTADNIGLKISLLLNFQITDPVKVTHDTQNWQCDLYNLAQLALRAVVAAAPVEALLNQRLDIAAQLTARVQPAAAKIGLNVLDVEVKDVMFPAELKRAFAEVLKAKQEGQAALERARGESAALRNLANAARVLDGNPALMNLRLMQSISAAQNAGNTLVLGMPNGFVPLQKGNSAPEKAKDGT